MMIASPSSLHIPTALVAAEEGAPAPRRAPLLVLKLAVSLHQLASTQGPRPAEFSAFIPKSDDAE